MFITGTLLALMAGYLLLVYASKQKSFHKRLGAFLSWLVMIVAFAGLVCGLYHRVKYGCPLKGYCHHYEKKYHHNPSHEEYPREGAPETPSESQ